MAVSAVPTSPGSGLGALVRALPLRFMLVLFAVHQVVMGVGATLYEAGTLQTGLFKLDGEGHYFVYFSALLLLAGAVCAVLAVHVSVAPRITLGLAGLLAFMAVDEAFALHERLERRLHVDWPVLYSPVIAVGGLAALLLLRRTRHVRSVAPTFLAGGACWAMAVVLEKLQWTDTGKADHYVAMMIPEELLEATGSFLFAVALALLVRAPGRAVGAASHPR